MYCNTYKTILTVNGSSLLTSSSKLLLNARIPSHSTSSHNELDVGYSRDGSVQWGKINSLTSSCVLEYVNYKILIYYN